MRHTPTETVSLARARRLALAAQGLAGVRPAPTRAAVVRTVERHGLLQVDSVNIHARAHRLPLQARLGAYATGDLDRLSQRAPRRLVECWAHEASFVPPDVYHDLAWWRELQRERRWARERIERHPGLSDEVLAVVRDRGASTAREIEDALGAERPGGGWWNHSAAKRMVELLFILGDLTSAGRTSAFERRYDLPERVVPPRPTSLGGIPDEDPAEAQRRLVLRSARAHGIATAACLRDYYRLRADVVAPAIDRLVEEGELRPVTVPGWGLAYLAAGAREPRVAHGRALLAPFDPLIFERSRLLALFGMHYRIGIYTPAPQRTHGYYVLPFLLGSELVARVDLKADRATGRLLVREAHLEAVPQQRTARERSAWPSPSTIAHELRGELEVMAGWLGLGDVVVGHEGRGDLLPALG